jgi:cell division protein FtsI/penicillin-binding protein 2
VKLSAGISTPKNSTPTRYRQILVAFTLLAVVVFGTDFFSVKQSQSRTVLYGPSVLEEINKRNVLFKRAHDASSTQSSVSLRYRSSGIPEIAKLSGFDGIEEGKFFSTSEQLEKVFFTLDPDLHRHAEKLLEKYRVPWGAIVAVDPATGKILALAGHSEMQPGEDSFALRASLPAASLFKIVTGAAAVETSGIDSYSEINFRGGNYTLSRGNYLPSDRLDRRHMSFAEAMAKSCNPVFARLALRNLNEQVLTKYANGFGFNMDMSSEFPLHRSSFELSQDQYLLARTAAGFGDAFLSPVHAAMLMATVSNGGTLLRPYMINEVHDGRGKLLYKTDSVRLRSSILSSTAEELLSSMQDTVRTGTAKRAFKVRTKGSPFSRVSVAAKTGTLSGTSPKGLYRWLVASIPAENPEITIAAVVVDPGHARINGVELGRQFLDYYFSQSNTKEF